MFKMEKHDRQRVDYDDTPSSFLPPDPVESVTALLAELRTRLVQVEQQVLAQYTATAAYATLAQQAVETARAESRADLDRMQSTLIGLLEQHRSETLHRLDGIEARPAVPTTSLTLDAASRLAAAEELLRSMAVSMDACVRENLLLRRQVDELLQRQMREEGWLVSSGSASELSLR